MATVSERAKKLGEALDEFVTPYSTGSPGGFLHYRADALIEQALLAERRLAKLEDAEIAAEHERNVGCDGGCGDGIAQALRAAAEKEVGT